MPAARRPAKRTAASKPRAHKAAPKRSNGKRRK
jgi:hypothetical protein